MHAGRYCLSWSGRVQKLRLCSGLIEQVGGYVMRGKISTGFSPPGCGRDRPSDPTLPRGEEG